MRVTAVKTMAVKSGSVTIEEFLDDSITALAPGSVVAITSKVVALCQERTVESDEGAMARLVPLECQHYLPAELNEYGVWLTVKAGRLMPNAGIDRSNADGLLVLWPEAPQETADAIRAHLVRRFGHDRLGVILTDSTTAPLRAGVTGICIAHSGFSAIKSLVGRPDIFGRPLRMTKINVADALAASAVLVMGEADEQTPLAIIEQLDDFVEFTGRAPTREELEEQRIELKTDLYGHLLNSVEWQRGEEQK